MMTMAPGIEAAASPHVRAASAAAAAAAAWYHQGAGGYPEVATSVSGTMHNSQSVHDPSAGGHPAHPTPHVPEAAGSASFFASSDAASRYYQMHYESAASQGKFRFPICIHILPQFHICLPPFFASCKQMRHESAAASESVVLLPIKSLIFHIML